MMTVEKFIDTASIDPVYYDAAYFLAPDGEAGHDVYAVLREAIAKTGKTALSRVVISQRERTIALRSVEGGLMAHTLYEDQDSEQRDGVVQRLGRHQDRSRKWCRARHPASCRGKPANTSQPTLRTATRPGRAR